MLIASPRFATERNASEKRRRPGALVHDVLLLDPRRTLEASSALRHGLRGTWSKRIEEGLLLWEHEVGGSSPAAPTGNPIWAAGGALVVLASDQLGAVPRRAGALARKHVLYWQRSQAQLRAPETQPGVDQPVER